jgi:hypothetical protein
MMSSSAQRLPVIAVLCLVVSCAGSAPGDSPAPRTPAQDDPAPEVLSVTPATGSGRSQHFEVLVAHPAGADRIVDVQMLLDVAISGSNACWVDFRAASQTVALRTNDGASWIEAVPVGQPGVIENRQCALATQTIAGTAEGNRLKVVFPLSFKEGMRGDRNVYVIASSAGAHTGWKAQGVWTIP